MASVRRRGGGVQVALDGDEVTLLRLLVSDVREMVAPGESHVEPADPLEELTGMSERPPERPDDAALARLLPDGYRDDDAAAAELRRLTEGSLRAEKAKAASALLGSLPDGGGKVRLGGDDAGAWLTALNDVRLVLGTRLDITEDTEPLGGHPPDDPDAAPYVVYQWLTGLQDGLVTALL